MFVTLAINPSPVLAMDENKEKEKIKYRAEAFLTDQKTNKKTQLFINVIEDLDNQTLTFETYVDTAMIKGSYKEFPQTKCHIPSDCPVKVTVTMRWEEYWDASNVRNTKLYQTAAKWERKDSTFSIRNAEILSGAMGSSPNCGSIYQRNVFPIGAPQLNYLYFQQPSFSSCFVKIGGSSYIQSGANSTVVRGTTSSSLNICIIISEEPFQIGCAVPN